MNNIKKIVELFENQFQISSEDLKEFNKSEIIHVFEHKPTYYYKLNSDLKNNFDYLYVALKNDGVDLERIPLTIIQNKEHIDKIFNIYFQPHKIFFFVDNRNDSMSSQFNNAYLKDEEFYKSCVIRCPALFKIAPEHIRDDRVLLKKAIQYAKENNKHFQAFHIFNYQYAEQHPEIGKLCQKEFATLIKKESQQKKKDRRELNKKIKTDYLDNIANIQKLPAEDVKLIKALMRDYKKNGENSIFSVFFNGSNFFDNFEEFTHYYESSRDYYLNNFKKYKNKQFLSYDEHIGTFGNYIGNFYSEEHRTLVYYKGHYYFYYSEGDIGYACKKLALFPLECLLTHDYQMYDEAMDEAGMTEDTFDAENPDFNIEYRDTVFKDWNAYQKFLDKLNIKIDVNKKIKKIKRDYLKEKQQNDEDDDED